jgi:hypothetical protein
MADAIPLKPDVTPSVTEGEKPVTKVKKPVPVKPKAEPQGKITKLANGTIREDR